MKPISAIALMGAIASPAMAEVKSASPVGFELEAKAVLPVPPDEAYAALTRIGAWWDSAHTYSGRASNLTLDARAGGCFCEGIPDGDGAIEHMRVVYVQPGRTLRLQGGLGPLQAEGVAGTLTWSLRPVAGGTEVVQTYVVGGYVRGGADRIAPLVDQVLGGQLTRFASYAGR